MVRLYNYNDWQISFHERKEEKTERNLKKVEKPKSDGMESSGKKFEDKIQKIEENICQWIDDEAKSLKETLEKDISSIRSEVDNKNIEINSKVQASIQELREEMASRGDGDDGDDGNDLQLCGADTAGGGDGWVRAVLDLKNKLHRNMALSKTFKPLKLKKKTFPKIKPQNNQIRLH